MKKKELIESNMAESDSIDKFYMKYYGQEVIDVQLHDNIY